MVAGDLSELLAAIEELDADAVLAWLDGCPPGTDLNSEGSLHRALSEAQPQDQSKHLAVLKVLLAAGVSPNVEDIGSDMLSPVSILVNHGDYDEEQMLDDDGHSNLGRPRVACLALVAPPGVCYDDTEPAWPSQTWAKGR